MDKFSIWKEEIMLFNNYCNMILFEYIFPTELIYYIIYIYLQLQYKYSIGNSPCAKHTFIFNNNNIFFRSGKNKKGQLGLGHQKDISTFVGDYYKKIITCTSGKNYTIILTQSGLYGSGSNEYGQLGFDKNKRTLYSFEKLNLNGIESYPEKIIKICCAEAHSIILTTEGYYVTGDNGNGELGLGDKWAGYNNGISTRGGYSIYGFKKLNNNISNITQVACGDQHSIILAKEGLFCTGYNCDGRLGLGDDNNDYYINKFTKIPNIYGEIIMISCGFSHTMILTKEGLLGSGTNTHGELGIGLDDSETRSFTKCNLPNRKIFSVACGEMHTIILTDNGIYSCGYNYYGQLGYSDMTPNDNFEKIDFSLQVIQLYCGLDTSMVQTKYGWYGCGNNRSFQLGQLSRRRHSTFKLLVSSK